MFQGWLERERDSSVRTAPSSPGSWRTIPTGVLPSRRAELGHGHPPVSLSAPLAPSSKSDEGGGARTSSGKGRRRRRVRGGPGHVFQLYYVT